MCVCLRAHTQITYFPLLMQNKGDNCFCMHTTIKLGIKYFYKHFCLWSKFGCSKT